MIRPIASVLVDFHRQSAPAPMAPFHFDDEAELPPTLDLEELAREAEERGFERGRAEAAADAQAEIAAAGAAVEQQVEARLEAARQLWAEEEGARLADAFDRAMAQLCDTIGTHTAAILQSLVDPAVKQRMVGEVMQAIETLTRNDATMLLRVEGPADLLESIRKALAGRVRSLDLVQAEGPDVKVIAQDTVIESLLATWLADDQEGVSP